LADPRPPITIRITRPYGSENEFIDGDFAWIGRTTIVLPHSPARNAGEVVRFEVVLTSGSPVFRGEGSVVAHYPPGGGKPPGLEVRFTRIDARSKLILDKVRDRRTALSRSGEVPAAPAPPAPAPLVAVAAPAVAPPLVAAPPFAAAVPVALPPSPPAEEPGLPVVVSAHPHIQPPARALSERRVVERTSSLSKVAAPPNRDEILERLRSRAKHLAENGGYMFKRRSS
jgi:hypothetical protein